MTPEEYAGGFDERIGPLVVAAAERVPVFRSRLEASGIEPEGVVDAGSLDRIPVLGKDELLELQEGERPFGGLLAADARVRRVYQSPGPLYEPELDHDDYWRFAPAFRAAGFGPADLVLNAASYHLSPLGAMLEEAARAVGCRVVPGGIGNLDLQVEVCAQLGVTAFSGLPSYLKALLERAEELGQELFIEKAFVSAEPLPPSLRAWLRDRVPTVLQGYGTAELGNLGYECRRMDGLHVPEDALVEVCGLDDGRARWDGSAGQVVGTVFHPDYPLIRFGTGDLSAYLMEECDCGLETPRLRGWMGRVGEAVKVRGMFLHPRQVEQVMGGIAGVERYRFVVERSGHRDDLRAEVVLEEGADPKARSDQIAERIRSSLRFKVEVRPVDELPEDGPLLEDRRTWE
ncbi:MAG: phenylacetate--CoA ligase family protein [Acidimicrobiia bacterium]